jgi:hypothetical protein
VASLDMPRSSLFLEEILVLGSPRLLSHSAMATFNLLVSSLRASFAPACNLITCVRSVGFHERCLGRHTGAQKDSMSSAAIALASNPGMSLFRSCIALWQR